MKIELRADSVVLDGYVNAVERQSRVLKSSLGEFVEVIKAGAFKKSLEKRSNVDLLLNHKTDRKLGSIEDGNLELFEDNIGLRAICTVTDREVIELARKNKLVGWSFGFRSNSDEVDKMVSPKKRYVKDLDLIEVSILDNTSIPAYVGTSIYEMRNGKESLKEIRTFNFKETTKDKNHDKYKRIIEDLRRG